jgi:hypothetical protein
MLINLKSSIAASLFAAATLALASSATNAAIIGVDIEVSGGSPTNWNSYRLADVNTTKTNLIAEDGSATIVGFSLAGVPSTQNFAPSSSAVIPSHSNDLTTVCCDILHAGPNPTLALWSGLVPLASYNYWVFVSSTAEDTITVTGSTVDSFNSPDIDPDSQAINGIVGSDALSFASYARSVVASASGEISIAILSTGTPTPSGYAIERVGEPGTVAEPASLALLGLGALGLGFFRRRSAV